VSICGLAERLWYEFLPQEIAMKYALFCCHDENHLNAMPKSDWDSLMDETLTYIEKLKKSGHYIGGEALESVNTATTVRVRNGKVTTTDGPFAETKEQLGGFILIEARDLNEAIQIAANWPAARTGSMEVRPVRNPENKP
jgi:hypothetical protein